MPGGDGTGPAGMGPMTGRAAGYCAGYPVAGYMNPIGGRGGWGRRNQFYATGLTGWQRAAAGYPAFGGAAAPVVPYTVPFASTVSRQQQLDALKGQAEYFEDALDGIRKRIEELEAKSTKD